MLNRLIAISLLIFPLATLGQDLGAYGQTWGIKEINLKQEIANEVSKLDTHQINAKLARQAHSFGYNLPPAGLPHAVKNQTTYNNPSVALKKNIIVNGKLIYRKGTWVNPLKVIRPTRNMLFFDLRSDEQTRFALDALKAHPYNLMLVATSGNPIKLSHTIHRPVYFANSKLIERFKVMATPTLLGVGHGAHQYDLADTTFKSPYKVLKLNSCWNGCKSNETKTVKQKTK